MFTKNKLILFSILFVASLLLITNNVSASITNGTIDTTYHYAWGENIGWVDFANITITDTSLSGSAYGENIGWVDLSTITNNAEGTLSGYAWGENVGWVDFSNVTIGTDGVFTGSAYGENIGWITFGTGDNKVLTDWRPDSVRPRNSSSGSTARYRANFLAQQQATTSPSAPLPSTSSGPTVLTAPSACTITMTLRLTYRGPQVKCLQTKLNIISDSIFGPKTKQAVITFQTQHNLTPDGIVGPITRAKLLIN